jgi:hypothetical protein
MQFADERLYAQKREEKARRAAARLVLLDAGTGRP